MLSSRIIFAPASRASASCSRDLDLDLDEDVAATDGACLFQCGGDAAGGHDVIFLDQDAVMEAETVVAAAAAGDGVFLRQAQAGQGLARVDDARAGAGDGVDVEPRDGGRGREQLQEIQRGALGGEQGAGVGFDLANDLASADGVAVAHVPANLGKGIESSEAGVEPCRSGQYRDFAADDSALRALVTRAQQ
jgi:hypothetical protein